EPGDEHQPRGKNEETSRTGGGGRRARHRGTPSKTRKPGPLGAGPGKAKDRLSARIPDPLGQAKGGGEKSHDKPGTRRGTRRGPSRAEALAAGPEGPAARVTRGSPGSPVGTSLAPGRRGRGARRENARNPASCAFARLSR